MPSTGPGPKTRYEYDGNIIARNDSDGAVQLTNFTAQIVRQVTFHDAQRKTTQLTIEGTLHTDEKLPAVTINAPDFASMNWVADKWGMEPIIFPEPSAAKDISVAIQLASTPEKTDVYTHTGWINIDGKPVYLTASGGITAGGLNARITVQLPTELSKYKLPPPYPDDADAKEAVAASLALVGLAPPATAWPLLLATYRAPLRSADFAMHLAGRTGTFKSEFVSLFQSHFGEEMDARHLPGSWSSTGNAIEALAYRSKDAIFALDDFVPLGTSWQVRQLQKTADQIVRAAGNQAGRSRLTDVSSLQQTYFPRCLILSTGEDVPEGHSVRGRMMILELAPGDVSAAKLTTAQAKRMLYPRAMSGWITWLAGQPQVFEDFQAARIEARERYVGIGHSRTPTICGDLEATARLLFRWFQEKGWWSATACTKMLSQALASIRAAAENQKQFLESADPCTKFIEIVRTAMASGTGHVRTVAGGIPEDADKWGWERQQAAGEMPTFKARGVKLGWVDVPAGEFLFDPTHLPIIIKLSRGDLACTKQTILKRMHESGLASRKDDARQRNTVRQVIEGHSRTVIPIRLDAFDDSAE